MGQLWAPSVFFLPVPVRSAAGCVAFTMGREPAYRAPGFLLPSPGASAAATLSGSNLALSPPQPRREPAAGEARLVQEVVRLKAQVEARKACFLEKYKECRRLHRQIRQLRAAVWVGDSALRGEKRLLPRGREGAGPGSGVPGPSVQTPPFLISAS